MWKLELSLVLLLIFTIIGYKICYYINYLPQQNDPLKQKKQHLILTWNSSEYHIHHWITFSIIIMLLIIGRYSSFYLLILIIGLSSGCILEGFLFDDWYKIRIK